MDSVGVAIDSRKKIIIFRLRGNAGSGDMADKAQAAYDSLDAPWTYHRLIDLRVFTSLLAYEDIERMAIQWAEVCRGRESLTKTAVVNAGTLSAVRAKAYGHLFPNVDIRAFTCFDEALDWLSPAAALIARPAARRA